MKLLNIWMLLFAFDWAGLANAQLQLLPDKEPQHVFGGDARQIAVVWRNDGGQVFEGKILARIFQTTSAAAVQIGEMPWKNLQVLPQQTVLESTQLDFPAVRAETKFLVQWLAGSNVFGITEVFVYPSNLLAELKPVGGDEAVGIFDPQNQFKPLLENLKIKFVDLENSDLENFSGRLAIIGPFQSKKQMREGLADQILMLARKGTSVVWLQPERARGDKLRPSFYSVPVNTNTVVVVQPELVANLPENPMSQLNLIYFCTLALHPQPPALPYLSPQP